MTGPAQPLGNLVADAHPRCERGGRVLEDHLRPSPFLDLDAPGVGLRQPGDGAQQRRLAAAALAHQRDALPGADLEIDPAQGAHTRLASRPAELEALLEPGDPDRGSALSPRRGRGPCRRLAVGTGLALVAMLDPGPDPFEQRLAQLIGPDTGGELVLGPHPRQRRRRLLAGVNPELAAGGAKGHPGGGLRMSGGSPGSVARVRSRSELSVIRDRISPAV